VRLICLPPAGGDAPMFGDWADEFPPEVELWAVQLPGRGRRIHEPPLRDAQELASSLTKALDGATDTDIALFGGSLGGFVAYEVAHRLVAKGQSLAGVFVYGSPAPHLPRPGQNLEGMSDAEFTEALRESAFLPEVVLQNQELLSILLPALRADHAMAANYRTAARGPLAAPIHVFFGNDDAVTTPQSAEAWRLHAAGGFSVEEFAGGHLWSDQDGTQKLLLDRLSNALSMDVAHGHQRRGRDASHG
jgi:medium-chain acyl-[acyl-carrier-protein] hydrolase